MSKARKTDETRLEVQRWQERRLSVRAQLSELEQKRASAALDIRAHQRDTDAAEVAELVGDGPVTVAEAVDIDELDRSLRLRRTALAEIERRLKQAEDAHRRALAEELRPDFTKRLQDWLDAWALLCERTQTVHELRDSAEGELGALLPLPVPLERYRVGVGTRSEHIAEEFERLYGVSNAWLAEQLDAAHKRAEAAQLKIEAIKRRAAA